MKKNPLFAPLAPTVLAVDTFSTDYFTAPQRGVSAFLREGIDSQAWKKIPLAFAVDAFSSHLPLTNTLIHIPWLFPNNNVLHVIIYSIFFI